MTNAARSRIMRAVRSKDTKLELKVRRLVYRLGYRYRLHRKDLPGTPDLVFPTRRKVIFVHGCFWHGHNCTRGSRKPKENAGYWQDKICRNRDRDEAQETKLRDSGWNVLIVWECEARDATTLTARIEQFLGPIRCQKDKND